MVKMSLISFTFLLALSLNLRSEYTDFPVMDYLPKTVAIKDTILKYDATVNVIVRLEDGVPIYGTIHSEKESKKVNYNYGNSLLNKEATFFYPQIDYDNYLIRGYSFPANSFSIKLLDAMTGKIVLEEKGGPDRKSESGIVSGGDEDSGTKISFSHIPGGVYFLLQYNEKNEMVFSGIIENRK